MELSTGDKDERPGFTSKTGISHWTFSVIHSEKDQDQGNDDHNSKVIVVPLMVFFDGVTILSTGIRHIMVNLMPGKWMDSQCHRRKPQVM